MIAEFRANEAAGERVREQQHLRERHPEAEVLTVDAHRHANFPRLEVDARSRPQEREDRDPHEHRGRRDPRRVEGRSHRRPRLQQQDEGKDGRLSQSGESSL